MKTAALFGLFYLLLVTAFLVRAGMENAACLVPLFEQE
jgi:hypothetical protein